MTKKSRLDLFTFKFLKICIQCTTMHKLLPIIQLRTFATLYCKSQAAYT